MERQTGTDRVKRGLAEMLKGGVIMDVVTPEQAAIAEAAGAAAVRSRVNATSSGPMRSAASALMLQSVQAGSS